MEWIAGGYIMVGLFKTFGRVANPNPGLRPSWLVGERNPLMLAVYFTFSVMLWPLLRN